ALSSLTADVGGSTDLNAGNVTTSGAQTYNDAVILTANSILASTGGGNIAFESTVDGAWSLTVNTSGITSFHDTVGGTTALTSLTTDVGGSTDLNAGNGTTSGAQTYNDAVILTANSILASTGGGNIAFESTVDGAWSLTVNTSGITSFHDTVGGTTALTSLTTDVGGSTDLNAGNVTTSGAQT